MDLLKVSSGIMTAIMSIGAVASIHVTDVLAKTVSITPDTQYFEDPVFAGYIFANYDTDLDQVLSEQEIKSVTRIDCPRCGLTSLKGIEYFTYLSYLDCSNNQISKLSIKKLPRLVYLDCSNTLITKVDVSNCPGLYQAKLRGTCKEDKAEGYKSYSLTKDPAATLKVGNDTAIETEKGTLSGWIDIGVKYYYIHGRPVKSWKLISNKWYYFNKNTCCMVTGKKLIAGKYYLFTKAGVLRKKGWRQYKDDWYYLNASGYAVTGWKKIGKKWYHFSKQGIMACNEKKKIGKKTYKFNKNGVCTNR